MSEIFLTVLNMSLTANYVIIFVIFIRLLIKKAPKVISYTLWGVVALRLIIPFSFESIFSLMPRNTNVVLIPQDIIYHQNSQINSGILSFDAIVNEVLLAPTVEASVNPMQIYVELGAYLWMIGIIALLIYSFASVFLLKRQLKNARLIEHNIYEADNLKTPFVLGVIRAKIYLPVGLGKEEWQYILLHEQTHIQRKDHIIKILAFIIVVVHWFNPLVWIVFILMSTDMELSCDERVLKNMNIDIRKSYANLLLSLAKGRCIPNGDLYEELVEFVSNQQPVSTESTNYEKISVYLKEEFINAFSPFYEILDFVISDYQEKIVNGNVEAVFHYKMIDKNYDKDPDTVGYIKEAKELGDKNYQQLYYEYLQPKESNFYFKAVIDENGEITLYTKNIAIASDEWNEVEISDYIIKSPEENSKTIEHLNKNYNEHDIADYIFYNYDNKSIKVIGLENFNEFGTEEYGYINEGGVYINSENFLEFYITYYTGSYIGPGTDISGPKVRFKMNLDTNEIIEKEFTPAPNYAEAAELYSEYIKPESIKYSEKVIELSDERMVEIGLYFKDYIMEIEAR